MHNDLPGSPSTDYYKSLHTNNVSLAMIQKGPMLVPGAVVLDL
jgi:hypothetical protein